MNLDDISYRLHSSFDYIDPKVGEFFDAFEPELRLAAQRIIEEQDLVLVQYADEAHIKRWEDSIQVNPAPSDLEQRRRYLQTLLVTKVKVGADSLVTMTKQFTGADNRVEFDASVVTITLLEAVNKSLMNQFEVLLKQVIPAHLYYKVDLDIRLAGELNLGAVHSGTLELEITDQYDSTYSVISPPFNFGGGVVGSVEFEITDQYDSMQTASGDVLTSGGTVQVIQYEITDQYDSNIKVDWDGFSHGFIETILEISLEEA